MSNIRLTKADGEVLNLPAGSITAIMAATYLKKGEDDQKALSLIVTSFRGATSFLLAMTSREVRAVMESNLDHAPKIRLKKAAPRPEWITLQSGGDLSFIADGSPTGYETSVLKDFDGTPRILRVYFRRHDGQEISVDVDPTDANMDAVDKSIAKGSN